jgi:hypothetical protein
MECTSLIFEWGLETAVTREAEVRSEEERVIEQTTAG